MHPLYHLVEQQTRCQHGLRASIPLEDTYYQLFQRRAYVGAAPYGETPPLITVRCIEMDSRGEPK